MALGRAADVPRRNKLKTFPYFLLLPAMLLFAIFVFYPFLKTIYLSFFLTNVKGEAVRYMGLQNFTRVFGSSTFKNAVGNSFKFAAIVGIPTFLIGFVLAVIANERGPAGRFIEILYSIPMAVAGVTAAAIWRAIMSGTAIGPLNLLLGTDLNWLQDSKVALVAVGIVTIWMNIGVNVIFLLSGLRAVPEELIESAMIDGAGFFRRLFQIVIPVASPQIFFVIFLNIIISFQAFGQIRLLTNGGPNGATSTLLFEIYKTALLNGRIETATIYSLVLFVSIFIITRIQFALEEKLVFHE